MGNANWEGTLEAMTLVMVRISGLMVFAPVFSSAAIPVRVKAAFVLAVSFLVAPVVAAFPRAHAELGMLPVLGELSVGLVLGMTLSLLFAALDFAGQVMGFQFSFSLVNLMDRMLRCRLRCWGRCSGCWERWWWWARDWTARCWPLFCGPSQQRRWGR